MLNYFYPMNTNDLFNLFNVFIFVNRHNGLLLMMPCSLLPQNIVNRAKPWFLLQLHILYFVFMFLWLRKCKLESIIITIFAPIYEIFYYLIIMKI